MLPQREEKHRGRKKRRRKGERRWFTALYTRGRMVARLVSKFLQRWEIRTASGTRTTVWVLCWQLYIIAVNMGAYDGSTVFTLDGNLATVRTPAERGDRHESFRLDRCLRECNHFILLDSWKKEYIYQRLASLSKSAAYVSQGREEWDASVVEDILLLLRRAATRYCSSTHPFLLVCIATSC